MPSNTQSTPKSSELEKKKNSPLDPFAEFQKLRLETEEINRKIMTGPPLFNSTGNSSNEMLGMLFNELKEIRREIKEIKEDVKENQKRLEEDARHQKETLRKIESEQKNQKEALSCIIKKMMQTVGANQKKLQEEIRNVQNDVTGIQKSLEEVQRKQQSQEQHLHELKVNVSSIQKGSKREPELHCEADIRRQIYGKWRNVTDHNRYFSAKWEGDTFMEMENGCYSYNKYKLGEEKNGWTTSVENNKIVMTMRHQEQERERFEYSIENERLRRVHYFKGNERNKFTFERVGDPDPE